MTLHPFAISAGRHQNPRSAMLPNGDFSAWTVPGCGTGLPRLAGSGNRAGFDAFAGHPDRDDVPLGIEIHAVDAGFTAAGCRFVQRAAVVDDVPFVPPRNLYDGVVPGAGGPSSPLPTT